MDLKRIYVYIEENYNIRLEVGDKMRIYTALRQHHSTIVDDTSQLIFNVLVNFGYESKKLKGFDEY